MICQPVTLSGYAEWPKVADAVIEALSSGVNPDRGGFMVCPSVSYAEAWTTFQHELWAVGRSWAHAVTHETAPGGYNGVGI